MSCPDSNGLIASLRVVTDHQLANVHLNPLRNKSNFFKKQPLVEFLCQRSFPPGLMEIPKGKSEHIVNGPINRKKGEDKKQKYVALPDPDGKAGKTSRDPFIQCWKKQELEPFGGTI